MKPKLATSPPPREVAGQLSLMMISKVAGATTLTVVEIATYTPVALTLIKGVTLVPSRIIAAWLRHSIIQSDTMCLAIQI